MNYLKVRWLHELEEEPIIMLSELDDDRYEVRKIEIFADGHIGFASEELEVGGTMLGELPAPFADEIAADPQFVVEDLNAEEFEAAWANATTKRT